MNTRDKKISIAEHNAIITDVRKANAELNTCKALAAKIEGFTVLPDCPTCKGETEVEIGTGDPAHNPSGKMLYGECPDCKGFGYVD